MKKVAVIYSSVSPSRVDELVQITDDDTIKSAWQVSQSLARLGYEVELVEVLPREIEKVKRIRSDLVFNLCDWAGRDFNLAVRVAKFLEGVGVPFTGAAAKNYLWGSQKELMKKSFVKLGLPTPDWVSYAGGSLDPLARIKFPAIVKPAWEHCGIGVSQKSVVYDLSTLKSQVEESFDKFMQPILVEEFIDGNEYQVTVLEKGLPWVLPPAEIVYQRSNGFAPLLTFDGKWNENSIEDEFSLIRSFTGGKRLWLKMESIAEEAYTRFDCRDYIRLDLRERNGKLYILEINVNPGIDWDPLYGMTISAISAGMNFDDLVEAIVKSATRRFFNRRSVSVGSSYLMHS